MKIYTLNDIVKNAKINSSFYKDIYRDIDIENISIENLPILSQEDFWSANTFNDNKVLTGPIEGGIFFKSGGTTGAPKFSVFSSAEWESFTQIFGKGIDSAGIAAGDKVGNLFYVGELYASFIFIMKSLEHAKTDVMHFPIAGATKTSEMVKIIKDYGINVLTGVPTTFINMASYILDNGISLNVKKIFYGGEALFDDQRSILKLAFPEAKISSIGYASVDAGHLGFVDKDCLAGEHYVFPGSIMEIVDSETGEIITDNNRDGKLVYTNLTRLLMPIIRYPVGDIGHWVSKNKFLLKGRSDEGARVGPCTINRDDIANIFTALKIMNNIVNFQLLVERVDKKDQLTVLFSKRNMASTDLKNLRDTFYEQRPMYLELVEKEVILEVVFKVVPESGLIRNKRTGKLQSVIDKRWA